MAEVLVVVEAAQGAVKKVTLEMLTLARELGGRNITANVIAPGFVETDMTAGLSDDRRAEILAGIPAKRYASPTEIADVVRFVGSEQAGYLNGVLLPVDGGLAMGI